ncbi:MAG TPA: twin-arginine translocation signal domain-containing protein, partial [Gemmatimonadaceae bacterium]|nr:twin-arginine translocation signal domain-containing protein [Gemmatimonadaceae bacterium]
MTRRDFLAGALALGLVAGCSEPTTPDATRVQVMALLRQVGKPETEVADPPAVRVFMASSGEALPGRTVVFTIEAPDGTQTMTSRITDANGVARLSGWKLGSAIGRYGVIAVTEEWGPIYFT